MADDEGRAAYWLKVAVHLRDLGVKTRGGRWLDWETLEVLAESNGMLRRNIPDPVKMAENGLLHRFYPRER